MVQKDPIVGEVFKGVQGIMKDQNMQKMAKDLIKGPMKGLNDLNEELNPLNLLGKLLQKWTNQDMLEWIILIEQSIY